MNAHLTFPIPHSRFCIAFLYVLHVNMYLFILYIALYVCLYYSGGWMQTDRQGAYLFEKGPRSFRAGNALSDPTADMIVDLGLVDRVIFASKAGKSRFLWNHERGDLLQLPGDPKSLVLSDIGRTILKGAWRDLWGQGGLAPPDREETIADWATRHFGPEVTQQLVDPMIAGIWAGDINKLSMSACFPDVYKSDKLGASYIRSAFQASKEMKRQAEAKPTQSSGKALSDRYKEGGISYTFPEGVSELPRALVKVT